MLDLPYSVGAYTTLTTYSSFTSEYYLPSNGEFDAAAMRKVGVPNSSADNALTRLVVSKERRETVNRLFSAWMLSTFTPAHRLEHPDLKAAFAAVGCVVPSRKELMGAQLHALYESTRITAIKVLKSVKYVAVTMDGWKKRAAEQGTPIVTVSLLLPDGQTIFLKVWHNQQFWDVVILFLLPIEKAFTS